MLAFIVIITVSTLLTIGFKYLENQIKKNQ